MGYILEDDGGGDTSGTGGGPDLTASSDSSGVGGGGSIQDNSGLSGDLSAQDIANSLGITGNDNFNFSSDSSAGPSYTYGGGARAFGGLGSVYGLGGASLSDLANAVMGGGAGGNIYGFGGLGAGGLPGTAGLPSPSTIGGTVASPVLQAGGEPASQIVMTAGDPQAQQQAQPDSPQVTGQQSGTPPTMWDQLASILGGANPISTAQAAEATPQGDPTGSVPPSKSLYDRSALTDASQAALDRSMILQNLSENTLNPNDLLIPYSGPGSPSPAPGTQLPTGVGGVASGTPPDAGTQLPTGVGGVASGTPPDAVSAADRLAFSNQAGPSGPPADRVSAADQQAVGTAAPGTAYGSRFGDITGLGYQGPTAAQEVATRFPAQSDTGVVPATDTAANLAMQGVDANPPGSLAGGQGGLDPNAFTGMQSQRFANTAGGAPGDITGLGVVPGTTADTATPPAPDSPADFATRFAAAPGDQAVSPLQAFAGTPIGPTPLSPFANRFAPAEEMPAAVSPLQAFTGTPIGVPPATADVPVPPATANVPVPRAAPGAPAPGGGGGGEPAATAPQAPQGAPQGPQGAPQGTQGTPQAGAGDPGNAYGYAPPDRGGFERGRKPQSQLHNVIANMFGGGQLGDTVASLMLQLGIPAALIMAARGGGGGGGLGMLSGRAAMSGAGRGGFAPQFARNLFPGPGFPNWVVPGVAGAIAGQALDRPQPPQTPQTPRPPLTPPARPATSNAQPPEEAPLTGFTTPRGGNMPVPRPQFTPAGTAIAGAQAPGGAISYINSRGGHTSGAGAPNLQPEFASRVASAARAYEQETGRKAEFGETGRSYEQQVQYWRAFQSGQGGLAARPGTSRHELGQAIDVPDGSFQNWLHRNGRRFGIQGLNDPRDPNHFQLDRNYVGPQFAQMGA